MLFRSSTIYTGTTVPNSSLGANGDYYLRTSNIVLYGPKTSGSWGSGTSLTGLSTGPQDLYGATNGTTYKDFILPKIPMPATSLQVYVNGVLQHPSTYTQHNEVSVVDNYVYVSFATAPASGAKIVGIMQYNPLTTLIFPNGTTLHSYPANFSNSGVSVPSGWAALA